MSDTEAPFAVLLPIAMWRILLAHLQAAPFPTVNTALGTAICGQLEAELTTRAAAACAAEIDAAKELARVSETKPVAAAEATEQNILKVVH